MEKVSSGNYSAYSSAKIIVILENSLRVIDYASWTSVRIYICVMEPYFATISDFNFVLRYIKNPRKTCTAHDVLQYICSKFNANSNKLACSNFKTNIKELGFFQNTLPHFVPENSIFINLTSFFVHVKY